MWPGRLHLLFEISQQVNRYAQTLKAEQSLMKASMLFCHDFGKSIEAFINDCSAFNVCV